MGKRVAITGGVLTLALVIAGCDEKLSDVVGPTPNLEATFSSIQREIFDRREPSGRAACTECHTPPLSTALNGQLNLRPDVSYASLVGVASSGKRGAIRVVAGDPENSYIVHKLEGRPGIDGGRMPSGGPYLTAGQIAVIKRWISLGAPNN